MLHGWWAGFYTGAVVTMTVLVIAYACEQAQRRRHGK